MIAPTEEERPAQPADPARTMRRVATGLLLLMAALFVFAELYRERWPALAYLRAFAEAAMVGGLADWFAVTALFRRPLGLPIPHTAIVPRNKDRIAATIGSFLRTNFLTPNVVAARLERLDLAGGVARWLAEPGRGLALWASAGRLIAQLLDALDNEAIGGMLRQAAASRLRALKVSPLLGAAIEGAIEENRHLPLLNAGIRWASRTLAVNEDVIREAVSARTGWLLRLAGVDTHVSDQIISAIRRLLDEVAADPTHPLRTRAADALRDLAFDLRHLPETQARVEEFKDALISRPEVARLLDGLWSRLKASLIARVQDPDQRFADRLGEALRRLAETIEADAALRAALDGHARRLILSGVANHGDEIVSLVSDTIRSWDARTVVAKLETTVGRDLQYIRINGTLIGGLVGLTIHTTSTLF